MASRRSLGWLTLALAGVLIVGAWGASFVWRPLDFAAEARELEIARGATLRSIAARLREAGVLPDAWRFELLGRALGREGALKAGNYLIEPDWSALDLLDAISGTALARLDRIALVEGWTFRQVRNALNTHPSLRHETETASDADVLRLIGSARSSP